MTNAFNDVMGLMQQGTDFAEYCLKRRGQFFPYGMVLNTDGTTSMVAGHDGQEAPDSQGIIQVLIDGCREGAKELAYAATALFADVRIRHPESGEEGEAIAVNLDHRDGVSTIFYLPYAIRKTGLLRRRSVVFAEPFSVDGAGLIFSQTDSCGPIPS